MDSAKGLIVDQTHLVIVSGKLVLQKKTPWHFYPPSSIPHNNNQWGAGFDSVHFPLSSLDRWIHAIKNQELPSNLTYKYWPAPMLLNLTIQVVGVAVTIYFFYPTDVSKNSFKTQGTYFYPYAPCTKNLLIVSLLCLRRDGHLTGTELHTCVSIDWLFSPESSLINLLLPQAKINFSLRLTAKISKALIKKN